MLVLMGAQLFTSWTLVKVLSMLSERETKKWYDLNGTAYDLNGTAPVKRQTSETAVTTPVVLVTD